MTDDMSNEETVTITCLHCDPKRKNPSIVINHHKDGTLKYNIFGKRCRVCGNELEVIT